MRSRSFWLIVVMVGFIIFIGYSNEKLISESNPEETMKVDIGRLQTHEFVSWGNGSPTLLIDLPSGYIINRHEGPDFDVHYVSQTVPEGKEDWARMGIYVGYNPRLFSRKDERKEESGIVGTQEVTWFVWETEHEDNNLYHREVLIRNFFAKAGVEEWSGVRDF